jgi:hypothetical protein
MKPDPSPRGTLRRGPGRCLPRALLRRIREEAPEELEHRVVFVDVRERRRSLRAAPDPRGGPDSGDDRTDPFGEVGEIRQRLRGLRLCRRARRQERQHDDHQRGEQ